MQIQPEKINKNSDKYPEASSVNEKIINEKESEGFGIPGIRSSSFIDDLIERARKFLIEPQTMIID